ncbi:MAG: 3-hydroxybutyryl-CoA dehydrogenase [Clostridia bacterium]|nr:3-hydroxybutyryl-CoA dehydrogenase [Clostridia bacterium]
MNMQKIAVLGQGQMGSGIVQVAAQNGFEVLLYGRSPERVAAAVQKIGKSYDKSVEKGRIDADTAAAAKARIRTTSTLEEVASCDIVIESISEDIALKKEFFQKLDACCPPETIFASNTSSTCITEIACATARPDRFIGMHFFNPVPAMKLVEVIRGLATSDEVYEAVFALAAALKKDPVTVQDSPGFVVNRVLLPMINEAVFVLYEGVASAADIDKAMKLGCNHPMGPLALADMIGLDTCLSILDVLYQDSGDPKYRACYLLRKMVRGGFLGMKSGKGFFEYPAK